MVQTLPLPQPARLFPFSFLPGAQGRAGSGMTSSTIVYDASIDTSALPTTCLTELAVCCPGSGGGNFFPISAGEFTWPVGLRAVLYFVGMAWCFLGVAIIADLQRSMAKVPAAASSQKPRSPPSWRRATLWA